MRVGDSGRKRRKSERLPATREWKESKVRKASKSRREEVLNENSLNGVVKTISFASSTSEQAQLPHSTLPSLLSFRRSFISVARIGLESGARRCDEGRREESKLEESCDREGTERRGWRIRRGREEEVVEDGRPLDMMRNEEEIS